MEGIELVATGQYVPPHTVTNEDMNQYVETNDEWISSRTGIRKRHFTEGDSNGEMAAKAAEAAIRNAGLEKSEIGFCIVTTFTPDNFTPSLACRVHELLKLPEDCVSFDLNGACSGFLYGLRVVRGLLLQEPQKYALLIGSELISRVMDFTDRATCVLFGDAAAAAVVKLKKDAPFYFVGGTRGDTGIICCDIYPEQNRKPAIMMRGKEVFRFATEIVERCIRELLEQARMMISDIDYVVCHQANKRILDHIQAKLQIPQEKVYMNLQEYGNTSSASIPLALEEMSEKGLLRHGMKIVSVGFGAGLTWGGVLMEY